MTKIQAVITFVNLLLNSKLLHYRKIICTTIITLLFLPVFSQKVLKQITYNFDANEKITMGKKAKFSLENKNGKLYIHQKNNETLTYGLGLFSYSDFSKYYDVDERFDIKFLNNDPANSLGISISTYDGKGNLGYLSRTKFMLSADGRLRFYNGIEMEDAADFLLLPSEPCPSYKPGEVNRVGLVRNSHDWYIIVNDDTVKHSYEEQLEPIINLYSGDFEFAGKCEAEIDNFNFSVYENDEIRKIETTKLKGLVGEYKTWSSCLNDKSKIVTLLLSQTSSNSKFRLSGLSNDVLDFYLSENKENEFTYNGELTLNIDGERLGMRKIKITHDKEKNRYNLTFNIYGNVAGGKRYDCDFDGDK